jgi:chromosome segregation ATPase
MEGKSVGKKILDKLISGVEDVDKLFGIFEKELAILFDHIKKIFPRSKKNNATLTEISELRNKLKVMLVLKAAGLLKTPVDLNGVLKELENQKEIVKDYLFDKEKDAIELAEAWEKYIKELIELDQKENEKIKEFREKLEEYFNTYYKSEEDRLKALQEYLSKRLDGINDEINKLDKVIEADEKKLEEIKGKIEEVDLQIDEDKAKIAEVDKKLFEKQSELAEKIQEDAHIIEDYAWRALSQNDIKKEDLSPEAQAAASKGVAGFVDNNRDKILEKKISTEELFKEGAKVAADILKPFVTRDKLEKAKEFIKTDVPDNEFQEHLEETEEECKKIEADIVKLGKEKKILEAKLKENTDNKKLLEEQKKETEKRIKQLKEKKQELLKEADSIKEKLEAVKNKKGSEPPTPPGLDDKNKNENKI